jgi:uncharacterized membrane protein
MAHRHAHGVESTARLFGHPIHPMLVPLPIGLLVGALATDIAYRSTSDPFWARGSFWLLIGGLATGLLAAVAGLIDFLTIREANSRAAGWVHLLGNVTALATAGANIWLRRDNQTVVIEGWGLWLSVAIVALLGITGWLGGELSYRYRIGVMRDDAV